MKNRQLTQIEKLVEETVRSENPDTIAELFQILCEKYEVTEEEFIGVIKTLKKEGRIVLEPPSTKVGSYMQYLGEKSENTWFYLLLATTVATLAAVYWIPNTYPLVIFRWIVGSIFVFYLPGFVMMEALFPRGKDLSGVVRFALSVVLSIVITPLIGLLLNYSPWGIRLDPIMVILSIFTLMIAFIATYRKYDAMKHPEIEP